MRFLLIIIFSTSILSVFANEYNVMAYGAKGDGNTIETQAIQNAVDACHKTGGIVVFPAGKYLTGTIYLKSNVTLYLQKGAIILGSTKMADYPENLPEYTFYRSGKIKRALIYAENCENIGISGEGTIDGQGNMIYKANGEAVKSYGERPHVIWMVQSKRIRINGIKLQNSSLWMQHYLACENLHIHNIEVYNHCNKNNDMIDINGCKNVIISDCRGDTDDDGITIKSTHAKPNENILINNCIISSHCNAIKCGTESNTGFKNIVISNCIIRPSQKRDVIYGKPDGISGISLEVVDGAKMDGISISNIVIDGPRVPLFIRLGNRARGYDKNLPKPQIGSIENITVSNITAFNADITGSSITGIPGHMVKNISLENIRIFYKGGGTFEDANRLIPENESDYPEATMFDKLSVYGLFIRHAQNISLKDVEFHLQSNDKRPALYLENVENVKIINLQAGIDTNTSLIYGKDIKDIFIQNPRPKSQCLSSINIHGNQSESIRLTDIHTKYFKTIYKISGGANKKSVMLGTLFK
ncbi:MAG: glycoside hydrolase [Bacteroidetes bacterium]|nr:MAG: glycoside hydrolase [Bacteroidota bacterium]